MSMKKYILLIGLLGTCLFGTAAVTPEQFAQMRERLRNEIVLGENYDAEHPEIKAYIQHKVDTALALQRTMRHDTTFLWDDQCLLVGDKAFTPYHVHRSYLRLHLMTRAWAYPSSPLYHDSTMLSDIRYGLDLLYRVAFNDTTLRVGNWWEWHIGIPFDYANMVSMLYDELTPEELRQFEVGASRDVRHCVAHGNLTYANQASVCRNLLFIGLLTNNEADLHSACVNAVRAFVDTTTISTRLAAQAMYDDILLNQLQYKHNTVVWAKEGLYEDGTFIQHIAIPYIGTYGVEMIELSADMAILLKGTDVAIPEEIINILPLWIEKTYLPSIYHGETMCMFMGRGLEKRNPYYYARSCVLNIYSSLPLIQNDSLRAAFLQACLEMREKAQNIPCPYEKMDPMPIIVKRTDEIKRSGTLSNFDTPFSIYYAAGDRLVHQMPRARFGLALSSNRIGKYEAFITAVGSENTRSWYSGDGATYLYVPNDPEHYFEYPHKINTYHYPGATADMRERFPIRSDMILFSHSPKAPALARAGGVALNGRYSTAMMQLVGFEGDLMARKAWFCLEDKIICLGADITDPAPYEVITTIENRATHQPLYLTKKGAYLDGVAGYAFLQKMNVSAETSEEGAQELLIHHGINPNHDTYAYALLPQYSQQEWSQWLRHTSVKILANTPQMQAVVEPSTGLAGICFWKPGKCKINNSHITIQSDGVACVMMQVKNNVISLAVSDPTQERESVTLTIKTRKHTYTKTFVTKNTMGMTQNITLDE